MEAGSITGGPVRFHEISRRWADGAHSLDQRVMTTAGGEGMLRRMGCTLPMTQVLASLFANHEWFRLQRFWSYCLTSLCANLEGLGRIVFSAVSRVPSQPGQELPIFMLPNMAGLT